MAEKPAPVHPGEYLREDYLSMLKLSPGALAKVCNLPRTRIERIVAGTSGITADTALRLGKALGTGAKAWLQLQNSYDLEVAKREMGKELDKIESLC
jgi:antitoxin HigA-1